MNLAIKDALKGTAFELIDEMLYLPFSEGPTPDLMYQEKSPKKSKELEEIVNDLKECLQLQDGGVKPV